MQLSGLGLRSVGRIFSEGIAVGRICERADVPELMRGREILRVSTPCASVPLGFLAYFFDTCPEDPPESNAFVLVSDFCEVADGDIVRFDASTGQIAILYRKTSRSNTLVVTENCNNRCLMCSQPPIESCDGSLMDEVMDLVPLVSPETLELGISGGEPSLLGPRLVELVESLKKHLPHTAVHLLSNGRRFSNRLLATALAQVHHPDLVVGVPIHSDLPEEHDYIAQANGAFDQAVRGILNLKQAGVRVEIRLVIHALSVGRLVNFVEFVSRNLLFVDHVALMGLELEGYARSRVDLLWIDPIDYAAELVRAVQHLVRAGANVSIYNLPLCVLPDELHSFARQSISDWKTAHVGECAECRSREICCGLFASGTTIRSRGIHARR